MTKGIALKRIVNRIEMFIVQRVMHESDLFLLETFRVTGLCMSPNDLHTAKDHVMASLIEYLKLQEQINWHYFTSVCKEKVIEQNPKTCILNLSATLHALQIQKTRN